jgi:hypothetical protein
VFAGMIAASTIGVFLIPMLYATFQGMREQVKARFGRRVAVRVREKHPAGED